MATFEKRTTTEGKAVYRVKIRLKGSPSASATFGRLTDAKRWVQQTETLIREGRYFKTAEAKRHTLGKTIDRYVSTILPRKPRTEKAQLPQLTWWKSNLGDYMLADVTPALIGIYRDKLSQSLTRRGKQPTPATINRYLAVLSHVFSVATREWGLCEENPLRKVSKMREPRGRVRFLSDEERDKLLQACKKSDSKFLHCIVVLALSTAARRMEVVGLKWTDVDLTRGIITLHETKNGERRVLPLTGYALGLMKEHEAERPVSCDYVFPSKNFKRCVDIRSPWETALKRAEIIDFKFHDLRHSAASYLAMNGASLAEIAEVLGHKTLQMVKRYAHLSEAHTSKVVAAMNNKIFGV